jgi:hypothetical protein
MFAEIPRPWRWLFLPVWLVVFIPFWLVVTAIWAGVRIRGGQKPWREWQAETLAALRFWAESW